MPLSARVPHLLVQVCFPGVGNAQLLVSRQPAAFEQFCHALFDHFPGLRLWLDQPQRP